MPSGVYIRTKEHREKISKNNACFWLGKKRPEMLGNKFGEKTREEANGMWKGDEVGYSPLHLWLKRKYGLPKKCEHCGVGPKENGQKKYNIHWANKTGIYDRYLKNWFHLCGSCHKLYDNRKRKEA